MSISRLSNVTLLSNDFSFYSIHNNIKSVYNSLIETTSKELNWNPVIGNDVPNFLS